MFSDIDVDSAHLGARDPSTKKRERGMSEEFDVAEMGDSGEETRQTAPGGAHFDSVYGWGWSGGRAD
jgi:hypothetical protein